MSGQDLHDKTCGCCGGIAVETPLPLANRPGLPTVAYRAGNHSSFKQSLLARLSDARWPTLRQLRSRDSDDFTIALLDAWAMVSDVLAFYQERIANEAYLRTATERLSILELARLIGYRLGPGLAASTHLAFILEDSPGMPDLAAKPLTLPIGTRTQSVPGPDEEAQSFETIEEITARHEWNALPAQLTEAQVLTSNTTALWLEGSSLNLSEGDLLLFVVNEGGARRASLKRVGAVSQDAVASRTRVDVAAVSPSAVTLIADKPGVWVLRTVAAPFGHNAPLKPDYVEGVFQNTFSEWALNNEPDSSITLSGRYDKILSGSLLAIEQDNSTGSSRSWVFSRANAVTHRSLAKYGIAGNGTRLSLSTSWLKHDGANLSLLRSMTIAAQSEELAVARRPLSYPVWGIEIALESRVDGLLPARPIAITGKRQRLRITDQAVHLSLSLSGGGSRSVEPNDLFSLSQPPAEKIAGVTHALTPADFEASLTRSPVPLLSFELLDRDGQTGSIDLFPFEFTLEAAGEKDASLSEIAFIDDEAATAVTHDRDRTTLQLSSPLVNVYDRLTVRINANVAAATHGEAIRELLGSGNATVPYQSFTLRQTPLTYVSATTPTGSATSLKVYVNDVLWQEAPFLYGRGADEHIYVTRRDDGGRTTIRFGDGINGARLPSGQNNIRAEYRKGIGLAGLVDARQISLLMSRPLGLKGVINPEAAQGAEDPESRDDARQNAPLTVLTLDRAVSLQDYEDFSRTFAGIAKAQAVWVWNGRKRSVFITVAGPDGAALDEEGAVVSGLKESLRAYGDPHVAFTVKSSRKVLFGAQGSVTVGADSVAETVMAGVHEALIEAYGFAARQFGQPVALSQFVAVIQSVPGVIAVDIDNFKRNDAGNGPPQNRLIAEQPAVGSDGVVLAAELLLLDETSLNQLAGVQ